MSDLPRIHRSLQVRLFLAHVLVVAAGVVTLLGATIAIAPSIHDRLMVVMLGPDAAETLGAMPEMAEATTRSFQEAMIDALLLSTAAATLVAVAISLFVSARIATPLRRLLAASRRIAAGHYAERVPADTVDELGQLAAQFNIMAVELEEAERRRTALIGDVAHELRTPLATIEGYTEGLLDGVIEPTPETWALLHDEVRRLRRLVRDLQEVSRAEARQLPLHRGPLAPHEVVAQAIGLIEAQYTEKGVSLLNTVPYDLPLIDADRDRVRQVLMNLLGNALRHTPAGGQVQVRAERDRAHVVFHVSDTGNGIAPEHLPHLFERFYRADGSRSRSLGGSGIGLTISKALVEAHDGRIWAASPGPGQGATFSFTLPLAL